MFVKKSQISHQLRFSRKIDLVDIAVEGGGAVVQGRVSCFKQTRCRVKVFGWFNRDNVGGRAGLVALAFISRRS